MSKIQDYHSYLSNLFSLLDNYLIKDLETMVNEIPARKDGGGVGFPALHSILSGMEFLGLLLSGRKDEKAFEYYWESFLVIFFPQYDKSGLLQIFREVMRNGTAHLFLVKSGVCVSKERQNHLQPVTYNGQVFLSIDLKDLYEHFVKTYDVIKNDLLSKQPTSGVIAGCDLFESQMGHAWNKIQNYLNKHKLYYPTSTTTSTSTSTTFIQHSISASSVSASGVVTTPPPYHP